MIDIGGTQYYIDLEALDQAITPVGFKPDDFHTYIEHKTVRDEKEKVVGYETTETVNPRLKEIDAAKYETVRMMLETLIDYNEEVDDTLGLERALEKTPLSFKIAFNTLYHYGILKEKE